MNISDQAARNYLAGRFPTPEILITIAAQTPFSIHWLLTGQGKKFVDSAYEKHTPILSDEMRLAIREECVAVYHQLQHEAQPKVVTITPDRLKTEKVIEAPVNTSKKAV